MTRKYFYAFFIACLCGLWLSIDCIGTTLPPTFNVLIINSYDSKHPWESAFMKMLTASLKQTKHPSINLHTEYLDYNYQQTEDYVASFTSLLTTKYAEAEIDLICVNNLPAFELFRPEILDPASLFYEIPLVFTGVPSDTILTLRERSYMSGIYYRNEFISLLQLLMQLYPNAPVNGTINVILDESSYSATLKKSLTQLAEHPMFEQVSFYYTQSNNVEEISKSLQTLAESIDASHMVSIIAGSFHSPDTIDYEAPSAIVQLVKDYFDAPTFSNDYTFIDSGVVGGCTVDPESIALKTTEMIVSLLNGQPRSLIPSQLVSPSAPYIDYSVMRSYGLSTPSNFNAFINTSFCFYLFNTIEGALLISLIVGILFLCVYLISYYSQHKKRKLALVESQKAREREQLKMDFMINMSHELRTPLNIILNASKLCLSNLQEDPIDTANLDTKLRGIHQNAYRLLKLVNNIIDITKLDCGFLQLHLASCNIVEVIEDTFLGVVDFAKRKDIEIIFDPQEEEILTQIDQEQMQRVLLNLLSNAIKFTPPGGQIHGFVGCDTATITITVQDTGIGIAKEDLPNIFHRFYQVDSSLSRINEGSGIGLCIVKDIITLHNGTISVQSDLNKGTCFTIHLPLVAPTLVSPSTLSPLTDLKNTINQEMSDVTK